MFDIKLVEGPVKDTIEMWQMKMGDVAIVVDRNSTNQGELVMRTNSGQSCIFSLDRANSPGQCWTGGSPSIDVKLLKKGDKVTLTVE